MLRCARGVVVIYSAAVAAAGSSVSVGLVFPDGGVDWLLTCSIGLLLLRCCR